MSQNASELRLEDLPGVKPHLITRLKNAGIESLFGLAISISIPHQLTEDGGILTGADLTIALDLVMKAKNALRAYAKSPLLL